MGWNRDNVSADDVGARRAVDTRRRSHGLAVLTFTAFLVSRSGPSGSITNLSLTRRSCHCSAWAASLY